MADRAACLTGAAEALEVRMPVLIGLIVREAGKSLANAVSEVREAVDFLRYDAAEAVRTLSTGVSTPLGTVLCISPWNFPLAIFTGQVAAALAAGNAVLAKPAAETPLIAAEMVRLLHAAGIPHDALRLLPGDGAVGEALVADPRIGGVMFTGSGAVARRIQARLAGRLTRQGQPIPLVAETGGLNAMLVDSSALPEQVVADVIASVFDSAGQRCSALRILCLQEEIADRVVTMLEGAMRERAVGDPGLLSVDVGPVISERARDDILAHVARMRARGHRVTALPLPEAARPGTFVAPTLIAIDRIADVEREVFGPVLHVLRYARADRDAIVAAIDATGYGLTFGLQTRLDATVARVTGRVAAGNVYVNRNIIGAAVGVQPFGGGGLSGTGPKAGGPLALGRLLARPPEAALDGLERPDAEPAAARAYADWLRTQGHAEEAARCRDVLARTPLGRWAELPGPVGERNLYRLRPRGRIVALAATEAGLLDQIGAILATGNRAVVESGAPATRALAGLPDAVAARIAFVAEWCRAEDLAGLLFAGEAETLLALTRQAAARDGPILPIQAARAEGGYDLTRLVEEVTISTNLAAAGGDAGLMSLA